MADALISPAVGGVMAAASVGVAAYSIKKIDLGEESAKIPLMGVMGAFVFAAQMINFTIPGTGSSGHIGGGLLLAAMLGPYAGFLVMTSVLMIQALFFADGGLLALGCNVFNLGFFACYAGYAMIFRPITGRGMSRRNIFVASVLGVVFSLQLGSLGVVVETVLSGRTGFSFPAFLALMQPIHLAIGLVEGVVTGSVIAFVYGASPETMDMGAGRRAAALNKRTIAILLAAAFVVGGFFSWYASEHPDGLEWAIEKIAGQAELEAEGALYETADSLQQRTSFLPDYGFKSPAASAELGTSVSGVAGGLISIVFICGAGLFISAFKRRKRALGE